MIARIAAPFIVLAVIAVKPAAAQESCDVTATLTTGDGGARFVQVMACGDADVTLAFTCKKGRTSIDVVLPLAPFEAKAGDRFTADFAVGKKSDKRSLVVVAPVKGGAGDLGALITLNADDPLWKALTTAGLDTTVQTADFSTTVGTFKDEQAKLRKFKSACGL